MDSTKNVLKSLDWNRLLRKSSEDEYDSDETYCEDDANETQVESPEITLHNKLESEITGKSQDNDLSDKSAADLKISDSKMLYRSIFVEPESYKNNDGTKHSRLSCTTDTVDDDNVHCGIDTNDNESTRETAQGDVGQNVDDDISFSFLPYDFFTNDDFLLTDTELDSFLFKEISLQETDEPCVPPLTLNRQSQQKRIALTEKVLPWIRKRRKQKTYLEKKTLPDRKCASFYIKKSNRVLGERADQSRSTFRDNGCHGQDKTNKIDKRKLKSPKKYFSRKGGRPYNGPKKEQNLRDKDKGHRSPYNRIRLKVLQNLEVDLSDLKRRLRRSVETRAEAFQTLSHVQAINKTLRFHLDQATGGSGRKSKRQNNERKFLLRYLTQQISKSEELEKYLDSAIAEADRLTQMGATGHDEESIDSVKDIKDAERYNICEEKKNIKTALRNFKSTKESATSSSEPRHISFSDEVKCISTQSSSDGESETGQRHGSNIISAQNDITRYGAVSTKLSSSEAEDRGIFKSEPSVAGVKCPMRFSETPLVSKKNKNWQILRKQLKSIEIGENTDSFGTELTREKTTVNWKIIEQRLRDRSPDAVEERRSNLKRDDYEKKRSNTGGGQCDPVDCENEQSLSKLTYDHDTSLASIETGQNLPLKMNRPTVLNGASKSSASPELFQTESGEIVSPPSIQQRKDFKSTSDGSNDNCAIVDSPSIQMTDEFKFGDEEGVAEAGRNTDAENSENQTEADSAFGFSELKSGFPQLNGESNWTPYTVKDIIAVRIKDPSEFVDLDDLPEGAMDPETCFDFEWKD